MAEGDGDDEWNEEPQNDDDEYEVIEGIEEHDALALNAIAELDGVDDQTTGEAIQLQLATLPSKCWLNAALQCLMQMPPLLRLFFWTW